MARKIRIKRKVSGTGAPPVLEYGELACDTAGTIYIGDINGVPVTIQGGGGATQDLYSVVSGTAPNGTLPLLPSGLIVDTEGRTIVFNSSINTIDPNAPIVGAVNTQATDFISSYANLPGATCNTAVSIRANLSTANMIDYIGNDTTGVATALSFHANSGTTDIDKMHMNGGDCLVMDWTTNDGTASFFMRGCTNSGTTATIDVVENTATATTVQKLSNSGTASVISYIENTSGSGLGTMQSISNTGTLTFGTSFLNAVSGSISGAMHTLVNSGSMVSGILMTNGGQAGSLLHLTQGAPADMSGSVRALATIKNSS